MKRLLKFSPLLLLLTGCLPNVPGNLKVIEAKFNKSPDLVIEELKAVNDFEDANIKWTVSYFGDSVKNNLKIFLINGNNLPTDDSSLYLLGNEEMKILFQNIDNESDYENFVVYFKNERKNGVLVSGIEKTFSYKISDINK